eukprot:TCONS_00071911-protein
MIDETAIKPVVQYHAPNTSIYGFSAMPRFVIGRNVCQNLDIKASLIGLNIQKDTKSNKEIYGITEITFGNSNYFIAYAQFKTYTDWKKALDMGDYINRGNP